MERLRVWIYKNQASRYMIPIWNKQPPAQARDIAAQFGVSDEIGLEMMPVNGTRDMFPDAVDMARATWEVIEWPFSPEQRWKISEVYRKKLTRTQAVAEASVPASAAAG